MGENLKARHSFKVVALLAAALLGALALSHPPAGQVAVPAMPQTTVTLTAVAGATLKSWQATTNFGSDPTLYMSHSHIDTDENAAMLVRFDLSSLPSDAIIDSANFQLYLESSSGLTPVDLNVYYVRDAWTESTVTWNTMPRVFHMGVVWHMDAASGWKSLGIAGWVSNWQTGENDGLLLYGPATGTAFYQRKFASREHSTNLPGLVVTYHLPPPPRLLGNVYAGSEGDERASMSGVTVALFGPNNQNAQGTLMSSTTTDARGAYSLTESNVFAFYSIVETDPPGYSPVAGSTVSGTVVNANWIQVAYPLTDKTLASNKF
jgi:hypothetical protein